MWVLFWWPLVDSGDVKIKDVEIFLKGLHHSTEQWASVVFVLVTLFRITRGQEEDLAELVEAAAHNKAPFVVALSEVWGRLQGHSYPVWKRAQTLARSLMGQSKQLPAPFLSGHEVKAMGWSGVQIGRQMRALRRLQLIGAIVNVDEARKWLLEQKP
jgi:hypothetical protein